MSKTSIEWCDFSINPLRARYAPTDGDGHYCEKISPGCQNCYSSRMQPLFGMPVFAEQRRVNVEHYLDEGKLQQVLDRKKPTRWFWCDMTDWMGAWVPDAHLDRIVATMVLTPQHTHLTLTKRHQRLLEYFSGDWYHRVFQVYRALFDAGVYTMPTDYDAQYAFGRVIGGITCGEDKRRVLEHVRLGVSVEDQSRAERFDVVSELGERGWNTMVSMEPLLERVDIPARYLALGPKAWVIPGGESGPRARRCDVAWIRRPVRQCIAAGVAVFVKQLGAVATDGILTAKETIEGGRGIDRPVDQPLDESEAERVLEGVGVGRIARRLHFISRKGGDPLEWAEDLRVREFPDEARP